jgi:hypothetical protein
MISILDKPVDDTIELNDKDSLRIYPLTTQHPFCDSVLSLDTIYKLVAKAVAASIKVDTNDIPRLSAVERDLKMHEYEVVEELRDPIENRD